MAAGRPVLVVPYAGNFETVGKRILVAWDGTREANRALNDRLLRVRLLADGRCGFLLLWIAERWSQRRQRLLVGRPIA